MTQTAKGYSDNRWATYKQIKDMGGQVRKGEKATHVLFYKFDDETQKAQDQPDRPTTEGKAEREHTRPPMVRCYAVFNVGQADGLKLERKGDDREHEPEWKAHQTAEKVLELYWPQVRSFDQRTLRQNSGQQARIVTMIFRFQNQLGEPGVSVARARRLAPDEFGSVVRDIEWTLVEMPLPKVQRVGSEQVRFLYEINWSDDIQRSDFLSGDFDNAIRFIGNAGDDLVRLAPFVRPLVQREWAGPVARVDGLPEARLEQFLFGARREAIAHLASPLLQLQGGSCFYCGKRIRGKRQVDHFVPWSRHPDDGLDNLVVTDASCNGAKRDHLAVAGHVERWAERTRECRVELGQIANSAEWSYQPSRTLGIARSIYQRLPPNARLWRIRRQFVAVDATRLRSALRIEP